MSDNVPLPLISFFVATTIAVVSSHIGLIRLIGNANEDGVKAIDREKGGVLIVVEFALVILIGAPLPFVAQFLSPCGTNYFFYAAWIIPIATLILAIVDAALTLKGNIKKGGCYYYTVVVSVAVISIGLLIANGCNYLSSGAIFFSALGLSLAVIAVQFLKSALRLAGYVT